MPRKHAGVQASLPLDDIAGDVVCLRGGDHRAVIEAGSVNFALKSDAEQEAILAGYRRWLNALAYPVQVLVRIVPTDVEVYLGGLRHPCGTRSAEVWQRLAQDHEAFVRSIARERTLLDRRCYVVVPAGTGGAFERSGIAWPWRRGNRTPRSGLIPARRALTFRCAEIAQGLSAFGVPTRRLEGADLVSLWRASLAGTSLTAGGEPPPRTSVLTAPPSSSDRREAVHA